MSILSTTYKSIDYQQIIIDQSLTKLKQSNKIFITLPNIIDINDTFVKIIKEFNQPKTLFITLNEDNITNINTTILDYNINTIDIYNIDNILKEDINISNYQTIVFLSDCLKQYKNFINKYDISNEYLITGININITQSINYTYVYDFDYNEIRKNNIDLFNKYKEDISNNPNKIKELFESKKSLEEENESLNNKLKDSESDFFVFKSRLDKIKVNKEQITNRLNESKSRNDNIVSQLKEINILKQRLIEQYYNQKIDVKNFLKLYNEHTTFESNQLEKYNQAKKEYDNIYMCMITFNNEHNQEEQELIKKCNKYESIIRKLQDDLKQSNLKIYDLEKQIKETNNELQKSKIFKDNCNIILSTLGIDKEQINEFNQSINELKLKLDINNNLDNEFELSKYQEEMIKKYLFLEMFINPNKKYYEELKELFTESIWNKLSDNSKTLLNTALLTMSFLTELNDQSIDVDFSGVCLNVCKVVEIELKRRIYDNYYYRSNMVLTQCENNIKSKEFKLIESYTLGSVKHILGLKSKDEDFIKYNQENINPIININERYSNYDIFKKYAEGWLLKQDVDATIAIKRIGIFAEITRINFRNPTAHTNGIDIITANNCLDYVIRTIKELKEVLELMRF